MVDGFIFYISIFYCDRCDIKFDNMVISNLFVTPDMHSAFMGMENTEHIQPNSFPRYPKKKKNTFPLWPGYI